VTWVNLSSLKRLFHSSFKTKTPKVTEFLGQTCRHTSRLAVDSWTLERRWTILEPAIRRSLSEGFPADFKVSRSHQEGNISWKMPLLGKKLYKPNPLPKDLRTEEEVFVIKETNEVFRSYEYPFEIVLSMWAGCILSLYSIRRSYVIWA